MTQHDLLLILVGSLVGALLSVAVQHVYFLAAMRSAKAQYEALWRKSGVR
jgi:hypothetical protein